MGSLNLDTNAWYQVNSSLLSGYSMRGTNLWDNDGTTGALWMDNTNKSIGGQSWQFWPWNSSVYLLRCKDGGSTAYLAVDKGESGDPANQDVTGDSILITANYDVAGASLFWEVKPWGDGTYYFDNLANGSDWRMNVLSSTLMMMDSNITDEQEGEHYFFTSLSAIDDTDYSTVNVPSPTNTGASATTSISASTTGTSTAQTAATAAVTATATSSAAASSSSGLSTGASAAIGASIGGAVVILFLIGFFFWRRRNAAKAKTPEESPAMANVQTQPGVHELNPGHIPASEMDPDTPMKYEVSAQSWTPPAELHTSTLTELPGDPGHYGSDN